MAFVQFTGVSVAFGDRDILLDVALFMSSGTKAALAGPNGTGKTTLLKIIAGIQAPDSGDRAIQKGTRISYLPQAGAFFSGCSIYEEAEKAYSAIEKLVAERDAIASQMEKLQKDSPGLDILLENYQHLEDSISGSGYWHRRDRIREVLEGLGFDQQELDRNIEELSGGWQMRVALAKVILENPDIMLLDEPTNYLDLEARDWLENFLGSFGGGFVVVSHDRSFLDTTVNEVYELWNGKLDRYTGTYSAYEQRRKEELETLFKSWQQQQEEIARTEDFIRRFRYKPTKAAQVQSRVKMLEKMEQIIIPEGMKKMRFSFPPAPHSGKIAVVMEKLKKSYGQKQVVDELSISIDSGQKIAFVGKNGSGKSTLMRLIAGVDTDYQGQLKLGSGISVAYFSQDVSDSLDNSLTVEEEAETACPNAMQSGLRNLLGAFLFRGDDISKKVSVLSGGERARLALLKLLLRPANLLVLDEPTNHLDLDSKDLLLDALKRFNGTVLFVSHDRFFIEGLADRVLELSCGSSPRLYYGDYSYYLQKKSEQQSEGCYSTAQGNEKPANRQKPAPDPDNYKFMDSKTARYLDKKRKSEADKLKRREEEILSLLEKLDIQKQKTLLDMALESNYSSGDKMKELQARINSIEEESGKLNREWEEINMELDLYKTSK